MTGPRRRIGWGDALFLALATALSLVIGGYSFGRSDHAVYLPFLCHYLWPELLKSDLLVQTFSSHHTLFWMALSWPARVIHIETLFFGLHMGCAALMAYAVHFFAMGVFDDRTAARLAVALLILRKGVLALVNYGINSQVVFTQTSFVLPILTIALGLAVRGRLRSAFALTGAMVNFQGVIAGFVTCMLVLHAIDVHAIRPPKAQVRRLLELAGILLVCSLPVLCQAVATMEPTVPLSVSDRETFVHILRARLSHHVFPFSWSAGTWLRTVFLICVGAVAMVCHGRAAKTRPLLAFALAVGMCCVVGVMGVEVIPSRHVMALELFRSTKFLALFVVTAVAGHIAALMRGSLRERLAGLAAGLGLLSYNVNLTASVPLLIVYLVLVAPVPAWSVLVPEALWFGLAGGWRGAPVFWLTFAVATPFCAARRPRAKSIVVGSALAVVLLVIALERLLLINYRMHGRLTLDGFYPNASWVEVQAWCRDHTPVGTLFLTPPHLEGFRCFSLRPTFGEWKDGGPHLLNVASALQWWERMRALGITGGSAESMREAYSALAEQQVRRLARIYGFRYVICIGTQSFRFDALWGNRAFTVYRVPSALPDKGTTR